MNPDQTPSSFDFGTTIMPADKRRVTDDQPSIAPMLVCFEGPERRQKFAINRLETLIGRSSESIVLISDDLASRRHARILYKNWLDPTQEPECFLEDLASRNGTELNGMPVTGTVRLQNRDRIQIGSTVLGYLVKDQHEMQLDQSLANRAMKDALTGLDNRHAFESELRRQVNIAHRASQYLGMLIIDADRFKSINDRFGHDVGDVVLVRIATAIRECCRANEMLARWGGEEFVVLLPNCNLDHLEAAGERIRHHVESQAIEATGTSLQVTVSIGGAVLGADEDATSLFRRADQRVLQAKQQGRNRVLIDPQC